MTVMDSRSRKKVYSISVSLENKGLFYLCISEIYLERIGAESSNKQQNSIHLGYITEMYYFLTKLSKRIV